MCVLLFHGASPVVTARLYEESVRSPQKSARALSGRISEPLGWL